ncbi:MAG: hypothetical protein CM15mP115_16350 [Alphaproteobacteria bacterium]|nr:MAG: hypothetical protein CM15mP115_16350 [Alphaproteobacteria bacterium]
MRRFMIMRRLPCRRDVRRLVGVEPVRLHLRGSPFQIKYGRRS